ncbi:MAG: NADH-quinone oxidoreductase subunit NuoE [Alphaproteobacteria bacterium]
MVGKHHLAHTQFEQSFAFTDENLKKAQAIIARYPAGRQQSALMPLLTLAQKQNANWLSKVAMDYVADMLSMPPVRVYEVASFYTMYNLEPVGRHTIELCTTTPCWLRGSDGIVDACKSHLGIGLGQTTPDGQFTLREVECLGACVNAPMCSIDDVYYEDLSPDSMTRIIDTIARGNQPKPGPQSSRRSSEPVVGLTSLKEVK